MKHQKFTLVVTVLALLAGCALAQAQSKATVDIKELIFDSLSDGPHLSEAWFPGIDGYLVLATKEAHKHQVLQAK